MAQPNDQTVTTMRQHRYYEIPREAYLFFAPEQSGAQITPEERVRQWSAFELVRAYGYLVTDLTFEHPVKVGSKTYRIDILVKQNGVPWIVVECKEPGFKNGEKAIEQAISYANAAAVGADFAVFTNGTEWLVRRKVEGEWTRIPNLPRFTGDQTARELFDVLNALHEMAPLVYKLGEAISGKDACRFLQAMQILFYGHNLITSEAHKLLVSATDGLLRAMSVEDADDGYRWGKLRGAQHDWHSYRKHVMGIDEELCEVGGGFWPGEVSRLRFELENISKSAPKPFGADVLLLRLNIALLDYSGQAARKREKFPVIGPAIHSSLRNFLNFGLKVHLDTELPDEIDVHTMADVRSFCAAAWDALH